VLQPGEVGVHDAKHRGLVGGVELTGLAVAAGVELDNAEVTQADLARGPGHMTHDLSGKIFPVFAM